MVKDEEREREDVRNWKEEKRKKTKRKGNETKESERGNFSSVREENYHLEFLTTWSSGTSSTTFTTGFPNLFILVGFVGERNFGIDTVNEPRFM